MTLLARVTALLARERIRVALIGASALAVHGVSRSTVDIDLLTTDVRALAAKTWILPDAAVDIRPGDADDPLAGVIRISHPDERDIDIVVGRTMWQAALVEQARPLVLGDATVGVVEAPGLILLKLYAGGSQDAWDIGQLLAAGDRAVLSRAVDALVVQLPADAQALWQRLR
jgi:hypothetical protein